MAYGSKIEGGDKGTIQKNESLGIMIIINNRPIIIDSDDIIKCYFIEDIFKFCISGKLIFNDRFGLFEFGPFTGNEQLAIVYGIDTDINLFFDIYKVNRISQGGTVVGSNMIELIFTDTFFQNYQLRKYSRSWTQQKTSNMMKDIINYMLGATLTKTRVEIEESSTIMDFAMPYWTPRQAINFLGRRSKGIKSNTSGYLCYNSTSSGAITTHLKTLNYLFEDLDRKKDRVSYIFEGQDLSNPNKVLEWWIYGIDRTSNKGIRGGTWRGYDFKRKLLLNQNLIYSDAIAKSTLLGKKSLYSDTMDDTESTQAYLGDDMEDEIDNIAYNDWIKRYSLQNVVNIIVEGHEKRFAGGMIEIEWPSYSDQRKNNELMKGNYLIKSVTHQFEAGSSYFYKQRMVLLKNAYHIVSADTDLVNAVKINSFDKERERKIRRIIR